MPVAVLPGGFFYSKDLFTQAGITQPPTTLAELQADVDKLKALGIQPIALGAKDAWPAAFYYYFFALRECSPATVTETAKSLSFDDPCWLKAGQDVQASLATKPFNNGFLTTSAQQGAGQLGRSCRQPQGGHGTHGRLGPGRHRLADAGPEAAARPRTGSRSPTSTVAPGARARCSAASTGTPALRRLPRPSAPRSSTTLPRPRAGGVLQGVPRAAGEQRGAERGHRALPEVSARRPTTRPRSSRSGSTRSTGRMSATRSTPRWSTCWPARATPRASSTPSRAPPRRPRDPHIMPFRPRERTAHAGPAGGSDDDRGRRACRVAPDAGAVRARASGGPPGWRSR